VSIQMLFTSLIRLLRSLWHAAGQSGAWPSLCGPNFHSSKEHREFLNERATAQCSVKFRALSGISMPFCMIKHTNTFEFVFCLPIGVFCCVQHK
jgi:hypothetical protein